MRTRIIPIEVRVGPNEHTLADGTKRIHGSLWEDRWRVEVDLKTEQDAEWLQSFIEELLAANDV